MFIRLLASLVLLGALAPAQTPVSPTPAPPHRTAPISDTPEPGLISDIPATPLEKIGHGVSAPVPIYTPQAKYTREAKKKKIQGVCIVSLIVDAHGLPQNPKVVQSVGYGLDEAAIKAVKTYRFKPSMKDGHPVPVPLRIQVNFRLY